MDLLFKAGVITSMYQNFKNGLQHSAQCMVIRVRFALKGLRFDMEQKMNDIYNLDLN